ncbi:hypothetical protein [Paenibacillus gallinarum]|uniref:Uncharacterized protein n=1 Tax=Paenibacillus gallinarum TaxID=2762232 RepID=A0ABR8SWM5_9BACL|nr:hypothetical protein [Paenibacillus gallinarum]MBD7967907.1 hypothetical protein [Paenibacillus gallinarum]
MNKMFVSRKVGYLKHEVDVLERASLQVQSIYDRAATMAKHYYFSLDLSYPTALQQVPRTYFQKWIYTTKGWKFIGSEYTLESTKNPSTMAPLISLCLQALIYLVTI